jgi:hypothetical protein
LEVSGCFVFPVRLAGADHDRADHRSPTAALRDAWRVHSLDRSRSCSNLLRGVFRSLWFCTFEKKSEAKLDLASCRGLFLWVLDDLDQSICSPKHKLNQF